MFGLFDIRRKLWPKLANKAYREAYVAEQSRRWIASQIRALREDPMRDWSQKGLAERLDKPQSVVSRLEDPTYGKMSLNTLLEVAAAFDVAMLVRFVDFPTFIRATRNLTAEAMRVADFARSDWGRPEASQRTSFADLQPAVDRGASSAILSGAQRQLGKSAQSAQFASLPRPLPHLASLQ